MTQQETEVREVTTVSSSQKPAISTASPQKTYQTKKAIFRSYQVIWYIMSVIEVLLIFRIVLKLLGASTASGFTTFIYAISGPFALPFAGILQTTISSDFIFEWSTLIAMAVYVVLAYGVIELLQIIKPTTPQEVEQSVDNAS